MVQKHDIFDTNLIEQFRSRAMKQSKMHTEKKADFLLNYLCDDLSERLAAVDRHFTHAFDLHSHTSLMADRLQKSGKTDKITRIESNPHFLDDRYPHLLRPRENLGLQRNGEQEQVGDPAKATAALVLQAADLVISLASLHLTNDTPGTLMQIRQLLKPDGLFLAAAAGAGTLTELRASLIEAESELYDGISPRIAPFMDVRDAGTLLQRAGFALPVADSETLIVRYENVFDLMHDLRAMGMQNALISRSRRPVSKNFFIRAAQIYQERFSDTDGRIRASFNFIWLSGWAPHKDQQKPAPRGSATTSLRQFLQ